MVKNKIKKMCSLKNSSKTLVRKNIIFGHVFYFPSEYDPKDDQENYFLNRDNHVSKVYFEFERFNQKYESKSGPLYGTKYIIDINVSDYNPLFADFPFQEFEEDEQLVVVKNFFPLKSLHFESFMVDDVRDRSDPAYTRAGTYSFNLQLKFNFITESRFEEFKYNILNKFLLPVQTYNTFVSPHVDFFEHYRAFIPFREVSSPLRDIMSSFRAVTFPTAIVNKAGRITSYVPDKEDSLVWGCK